MEMIFIQTNVQILVNTLIVVMMLSKLQMDWVVMRSVMMVIRQVEMVALHSVLLNSVEMVLRRQVWVKNATTQTLMT